MPLYNYKAINENGKKITGELDADSSDMANAILSGKGLIPTQVKEGGKSTGKKTGTPVRFGRIKPEELIIFTKQFRTLLNSGIPMLRTLNILEEQCESPKLKYIINTVYEDIHKGLSLFHAFQKHESTFSPLYCNMLQAGEETGTLPEVLDRLIYIIDHEHKIKSEIKSAMTYPIIVVIALFIAFIVLLTFVIPKFVKVFEAHDVPLPIPTKICVFMYNGLANYWYLIILVFTGIIIGLKLYLKTPRGQYQKDLLFLKIPILGVVVMKASMSRFASIFSILQSTGIVVLNSLKILSNTIGNSVISHEFDQIREKLERGGGIAGPLSEAKYFPPMIVSMVAIGEESGNLDGMLREAAAHYDAEVEYAIKKLTDMIGPLLVLGLAGVVGFFALSIFLPMWNLSKILR